MSATLAYYTPPGEGAGSCCASAVTCAAVTIVPTSVLSGSLPTCIGRLDPSRRSQPVRVQGDGAEQPNDHAEPNT